MSLGRGRLSRSSWVGVVSSSSMISLQRSMHSSQMYTPGPAISFLTCFWLFPQNEHFRRSPPSPMRAMVLGAYFLFTVSIVLCRVYFPTLPACCGAMRPLEPNRVGDIRACVPEHI